MMTNFIKLFLLSFGAIFLLSCNNDEANQQRELATSFATAFFNWEYKECLDKVTPESESAIRFMASNVSKDEVERLRSMSKGATVKLLPESKQLNDSVFQAIVSVTNAYWPNSIDKQATYHEQAIAEFLLVKKGGRWYADLLKGAPKMAFPQQNEKQDRVQGQDSE